jgi:ankyrin repeat protein
MTRHSAFLRSARLGTLKTLRAALDAGADVGERDDEGRTALLLAAKHGKNEAVGLLLERGADVSAQSEYGETALTLAAAAGHRSVVERLLQAGADPDHEPRFGAHALAEAAGRGDLAMCELLLAHGAALDQVGDGRSALAQAVWMGQTAVAQRLIERGADVDIPDDGDHAPVVQAARQGQVALLAQLLARSRQPGHSGVFTLALAEAASAGEAAAVEQLLAHGALPDAAGPVEPEQPLPLWEAARQGHLDIVERLLRAGAQVNARTQLGCALPAAAEAGHLAIVERLLSAGADPAGTDWRGRDALGWALVKERPALARRLLQAGAWPPAPQLDATLLLIVQTDAVDLAQRLLDAGADPQARMTRAGLPHGLSPGMDEALERLASAFGGDEDDGEADTTALILAARAGQIGMVDLLLAEGLPVDARNAGDDTALIEAATQGHLDVAQRLLAAGADLHAANCDGWSALRGAAGAEDPALLAWLLGRGLDVNHSEDDGWSLLMQALRDNQAANARLLLAQGASITGCGDGYTVLMAAARGGCHEMLVELVAQGVDLHARWDDEAQDALMLAAGDGQTEAVRQLLALGANVEAVDREGRSALDLAQAKGHAEVAGLLQAAAGRAPLPPRPTADDLQRLVEQFQRYMPPLDLRALPEEPPDLSAGNEKAGALLDWLHEALQPQALIEYFE